MNPTLSFVADHVWQSTLFAAAVGVLTLAFRNNRAHVRYWLWLTASIKFLVPFAALVTIGRQLGWRFAAPMVQRQLTFVIDAVSQPFSPPSAGTDVSVAVSAARVSSALANALPYVASAIWFIGGTAILMMWLVRWRRVARAVHEAVPVLDGPELSALRHLAAIGGVTRPIALAVSHASLEPGVFGILTPVLVWPARMTDHLDAEHVNAILAHEVSHVRRHDNLFALVQMAVQALFWFHPLVWWLGARLVDERERACDEDVVGLGSQPQVYAESILKTCQFCLESPLACVSGVTGSDLKSRIERIMRGDARDTLSPWKRGLLVVAVVAAMGGPIAVGAATAPPRLLPARTGIVEVRRMLFRTRTPNLQAPTSALPDTLAFEVASIKPNRSGSRMVNLDLQSGGRFIASNVSLQQLVAVAYGEGGRPLPANRLLINDTWIGAAGHDFLEADHFNIEAKAGGELTREQLPLALQKLLADRFGLIVHHEATELPMYALVLARADGRLGSHLRRSDVDCSDPRNIPPPAADGTPSCGFRTFPGKATGHVTMTDFARRLLANALDDHRPVEDRTGLAGTFEFDLEWTPDRPAPARPPDAPPAPPVDPNGPSLFTALKEQLGLALEPGKDHIDILVVDRADHPTEN